MASWVGRKFASWQVLPASSARALRDRGALSPLRTVHKAIELLFYEPLRLAAPLRQDLAGQISPALRPRVDHQVVFDAHPAKGLQRVDQGPVEQT